MITVCIYGMRLESEANKRDGHYGQRSKRRAAIRTPVKFVMGAKVTKSERAELTQWLATGGLTITVVRIAPRMLDRADNLPGACKATVDGIADWLGIDDRKSIVHYRYEQRKDPMPHTYAVEIRIEPRRHCEACGQVVTQEVA